MSEKNQQEHEQEKVLCEERKHRETVIDSARKKSSEEIINLVLSSLFAAARSCLVLICFLTVSVFLFSLFFSCRMICQNKRK